MIGSTCCPTVESEAETLPGPGFDNEGSYFHRKDLPNAILIKPRNRRLILKERKRRTMSSSFKIKIVQPRVLTETNGRDSVIYLRDLNWIPI